MKFLTKLTSQHDKISEAINETILELFSIRKNDTKHSYKINNLIKLPKKTVDN